MNRPGPDPRRRLSLTRDDRVGARPPVTGRPVEERPGRDRRAPRTPGTHLTSYKGTASQRRRALRLTRTVALLAVLLFACGWFAWSRVSAKPAAPAPPRRVGRADPLRHVPRGRAAFLLWRRARAGVPEADLEAQDRPGLHALLV